MRRVVMVLVGIVSLIIAVGMTKARAQDGTIRIQHYTHAGCTIDGRHYLPAYADTGLVATLRSERQCLDMIGRAQEGCRVAINFQMVNPDGHPWKPNEKDPRCLVVFREEVTECIDHYEKQKVQCSRRSQKDSSDCRYARDMYSQYESACQGGNTGACGILPQALSMVKQACQ